VGKEERKGLRGYQVHVKRGALYWLGRVLGWSEEGVCCSTRLIMSWDDDAGGFSIIATAFAPPRHAQPPHSDLSCVDCVRSKVLKREGEFCMPMARSFLCIVLALQVRQAAFLTHSPPLLSCLLPLASDKLLVQYHTHQDKAAQCLALPLAVTRIYLYACHAPVFFFTLISDLTLTPVLFVLAPCKGSSLPSSSLSACCALFGSFW
jgi:hypothetical protein